MRETWNRIESWLKTNTPWTYERLAPPITEVQLAEAEAVLGLRLPAEFKASYRIHNGMIPHHIWMRYRGAFYEGRSSNFLYNAEDFHSLEQVVRRWQDMKDATLPGTAGMLCEVVGPIKPEGRCRTMVPVAKGPNFSYYLDMDPAPGGQVGQVIFYIYDEVRAVYIAPSYGSWLNVLAQMFDEGVYVYSARMGEVVSVKAAADEMEYDIRTPEDQFEYNRLRAIQQRLEMAR